MPTIGKQKKARKTRGAEMSSDVGNLDIMLGSNHREREEIEFSDSIRRPDSPNYNAPEIVQANSYSNSSENRSSNSANYGHISAGTDSSAEFNR